jgi:hypothetical protein
MGHRTIQACSHNGHLAEAVLLHAQAATFIISSLSFIELRNTQTCRLFLLNMSMTPLSLHGLRPMRQAIIKGVILIQLRV